jgi:ABC-type multidrug transport system fused ATPase/permease subunit
VHIAENILRLAGGACLLVYLQWRLAGIALLIIPGILLLMRYFSSKVHTLSHHSMEGNAGVIGELQESLSAAPLIKAFCTEDRTVRRLISRVRAAFRIALEQETVTSAAGLAVDSMPGMARVATLAIGAYWVIRGEWSLGSLLAFQAYLGYVFGPAQFLATANLQLQNALASLERIGAIFDAQPEERDTGAGRAAERLKGGIGFNNVSFSYDGFEIILRNLSFAILPGEHIAITGGSGVGKTTLLSLILGFYRPTAGEILFDGKPASFYDLASLRSRIGYVSQGTLLLSGSIRDNLRYGNPEATHEQVMEAARIAGIHDFILSLPEGYETRIGEKGVTLSEGQRQRLSIARALVKGPDILLMDEPASALDGPMEDDILNALFSVTTEKTLLVVTHRIPTIRWADRVLLVHANGKISLDTHDCLVKANDYYRLLVEAKNVNARPVYSSRLSLRY